jgi:hypothetical protein
MPPPHAVLAVLFSAIAAAGILAVVSCDDLPTTTTLRPIEDPWALAQGAGTLPLIVRGRPAFASDDAVDDAVFRIVTQAITWTATPPVTRAAAGDVLARYRLVYVFNGGGGDACAAAPTGGEPLPQGRVTLVAAFCDGGQTLVRVDGRVGRSEGFDDRRLRRLVAQATREMLAPPAAPRP